VFYTFLFVIIYLYIRQRKAFIKDLSTVTDNIMGVRGTLHDDHTGRVKLADASSNMSASRRRRAVKDMTDYLFIDDFYSELKKRNLYLSKDKDKKRVIFQGPIFFRGSTKPF